MKNRDEQIRDDWNKAKDVDATHGKIARGEKITLAEGIEHANACWGNMNHAEELKKHHG